MFVDRIQAAIRVVGLQESNLLAACQIVVIYDLNGHVLARAAVGDGASCVDGIGAMGSGGAGRKSPAPDR
jgi:hypothetical protein